MMLELELILLLISANGAPIIVRWLLGSRFSRPLDGEVQFIDNRPLFGASKTWRGLIASLLVTTVLAWLIGWSPWLGLMIATMAMLGDLLASFIKRRLAIPASGMALGLDQIPESLFPLLAIRNILDLNWLQITLIVVTFIILDYLLSYVLYRLHIRQHPY
jgi:CDP-2,3-bis-(O-geranylgeranyl)-sn-glycerol synthase